VISRCPGWRAATLEPQADLPAAIAVYGATGAHRRVRPHA
jgi:hypothetical protein